MKNSHILEYLKGSSRNKIIFFEGEIEGIQTIDVGLKLSEKIDPFLLESKIGVKIPTIIDELFIKSIKSDSSLGNYLAISNLGILFEPELKTDFVQILDKYSLLHTLFVKWEGEIEDGTLYFLTKEKGQKLDIKNLSHIVI